MNKFLALGCSHTSGVGIEPNEIYVNVLAQNLNLVCDNKSVGGNNSSECLTELILTLNDYRPAFVIAQWPHIYRKTLWVDDTKILQTVSNSDQSFNLLLKLSPKNFIVPWLTTLITADTVCKKLGITIHHIYLDEIENTLLEELLNNNITLYWDEKREGKTWFFDNGASDNLHHSPACHRLWAHRLEKIINENTPS